jgi:hypothetical protein
MSITFLERRIYKVIERSGEADLIICLTHSADGLFRIDTVDGEPELEELCYELMEVE